MDNVARHEAKQSLPSTCPCQAHLELNEPYLSKVCNISTQLCGHEQYAAQKTTTIKSIAHVTKRQHFNNVRSRHQVKGMRHAVEGMFDPNVHIV